MKTIFLAVSSMILLASAAKAETFNCVFTEPFISYKYATASETLTVYSMGEKTVTMKKVSFQIKKPGVFVLKAANGRVLSTLTLNNQGSDGMSDFVYPFTATWTTEGFPNGGLIGGCDSTLLKRTGEG